LVVPIVDFVWVNGTWKLSDKGEGLDLVAHDKDENELSLTYLMSSEAQQMLGVYLAPNGQLTTQLNYMLKKSKAWAELIRVGHLSSEEAWSSMNHSILKALEYPFCQLLPSPKNTAETSLLLSSMQAFQHRG